MFKFVITLIFTCFMLTVYAVTYSNSDITSVQDADEIVLGEALPIVMILTNQGTAEERLEIPDDIVKAEIVDRKMVNGTEFQLRDSKMQVFLCPKRNPPQICLAPRNFNDLDQLKCPEEPTPDVVVDSRFNSCGNKNSTSFKVIYHICPPEGGWYRYNNRELQIYQICYDRQIQKTLFATHSISSQKLRNSKLLHRERQLKYPYLPINRHRYANYDAIRNALDSASDSSITPLHPKYVVQNLVPNEDMPFGILKKPINRYINLELQHEEIFGFWNEINDHVRKTIDRYPECEFLIRTGVFDYKVSTRIPKYDQIIYNVWVKMIIVRTKNHAEFAGITFLMDNFLNQETYGTAHTLLKNEMEKYCDYNFCENEFRVHKVLRKGGRLNCCLVTAEIKKLFGLDSGSFLQLLPIPGLTII